MGVCLIYKLCSPWSQLIVCFITVVLFESVMSGNVNSNYVQSCVHYKTCDKQNIQALVFLTFRAVSHWGLL